MSARGTTYTVTGPGEADRTSPAAGPALSLAITLASRAREAATFYVRDPDGKIVGHAARVENSVFVCRLT